MKIVFTFIASGAVQINDIKVEKVFIFFLSGFQDILQPTTERTEETTSELDKVFQVNPVFVEYVKDVAAEMLKLIKEL